MFLTPSSFLKNVLKQILPHEIKTILRKILDEFRIQFWRISWNLQRRKAPLQPPTKAGVLLVGYPHGEFGLGTHLRTTAKALGNAQVPFKVFDFNMHLQSSQADRSLEHELTCFPEFNINIFCIGADQIPLLRRVLGEEFFENRYNILYTHWELSKLPEHWIPYLMIIDEIWASTHFIEQAFKKSIQKPIEWMPIAIFSQSSSSALKKKENSADTFKFLFSFDFDSYMPRKNPEAVIQAFQMAFSDANEKSVTLVIKTISAQRHHLQWEKLQEYAKGDSRIQLLNEVLSYEKNMELMESCDCYVSLHRAEGFGLTLAETMLRGKPVIATAYSGNMDFTTPDTACLVNYKLVPVAEGEYIFPEGQVWAQVDLEHASYFMKKVVSEPKFAKQLAQSGQDFILSRYSPEVVGTLYKKRVDCILKTKTHQEQKPN